MVAKIAHPPKLFAGNNIKLECQVSGLKGHFVSWFKNGLKLENGYKFRIDGNSLIIANANKDDEANYECEAALPSSPKASAKALIQLKLCKILRSVYYFKLFILNSIFLS